MEYKPNPNEEVVNPIEINNLINSIDVRMAFIGPQGANSDEFPILQGIKNILEGALQGRYISRKDYSSYISQVTEIINKSSNYH